MAQTIALRESDFFVNLNWLFPKRYLLVILSKRHINMPAKFFKSNEAIDLHKISKHSKFWGQITSQAKDTINPLMPGGNKKVTHT